MATQSPTHDFAFYTQAQVFENLSKSAEKRHMRIGGPIGSECEDIAKEVVLQKGLNYEDFLGLRGFFNKNHSQDTLDILGAPESVKLYEAGETMPDGRVAKHATTWVEGFLYDTAKGRETYELAKCMQGSGKSLGFSIEGHVEERSGPGNRTISKARIQNVAITHVPCNPDARLEVLLRSVSHANVHGETFTKAVCRQRDLLRAACAEADRAAGMAAVAKTMSVGGGAALVAQEGHDVPVEDAKGGADGGGKKPSALPLTLEELDHRIVTVARPLIQTLQVAKAAPGKKTTASVDRGKGAKGMPEHIKNKVRARERAKAAKKSVPTETAMDRHLRKAALIAAGQVADLAARMSRASRMSRTSLDPAKFDGLAPRLTKSAAAAAKTAQNSPSNASLLQSIFKAMPGVSVSYAQSLAETIRRDRARS